ncbi:Regulation of longevity by E3 ubiquitin-protein ligase [Dirofilaria immitis]
MAPLGRSGFWSEILCCRICSELFSCKKIPINLACGHTVCHNCLKEFHINSCPLDQVPISLPFEKLPPNLALLSIISEFIDNELGIYQELSDDYRHIESVLIELASYLHPVECLFGGSVWSDELSKSMQRKLISLLCYQLMDYKGLQRALRTASALAERALSELILYHQNSSNMSSILWSAIRSRGCQFLGPALQEEVLKLILLILSEGALMSRKTLVLYVVQTLREDYPQVSKTCIGHVIQLLYRASCFNVLKRKGESSLMQLKTQLRNYDALRREHDAQIVQVAFEQGLRISPDQWSALLYGDQRHRSHMQSIIDKLQSTQNFEQKINDLKVAIEQSSEREMLTPIFEHFKRFANFDYLNELPDWTMAVNLFDSLLFIIKIYVKFMRTRGTNKFISSKYARSSIFRQSDPKCKTHFLQNFAILKDMPTDPINLQCTYALSKNGFRTSTPQIQSYFLPALIEPMLTECSVVHTAVLQPQITEFPELLTNILLTIPLSVTEYNSFTDTEKLSVPGFSGISTSMTPIFPSSSLLLQIISTRFNYISRSDKICPMLCKMQMALPNLFEMQDGIHRVGYNPCIQNDYSPKINEMNEEQRLQYPQHAVFDKNIAGDDLERDKEMISTASLDLPSNCFMMAEQLPLEISEVPRISNDSENDANNVEDKIMNSLSKHTYLRELEAVDKKIGTLSFV